MIRILAAGAVALAVTANPAPTEHIDHEAVPEFAKFAGKRRGAPPPSESEWGWGPTSIEKGATDG